MKLKYPNDTEKSYTQILNSAIYNDTLLQKAKNGTVSIAYTNRAFNAKWEELKNTVPIGKLDSSFFLKMKRNVLSICEQVENITNVFIVNHVTNIEHGKYIIEVPIKAIYRYANVLGFLYDYEESAYQYTDNTITGFLYSYVSRKVFNQEIATNDMVAIHVFKSLTGRLLPVRQIPSLTKLKPIMGSLLDTYALQTYYPTPTLHHCNNCLQFKHCDWKAQ